VKQDHYATYEDCMQDWGDPTVCQSAPVGVPGYVGPRYYWNHGGGYPIALLADGTERPMKQSYLARGVTSLTQGTVTVATGVSVHGEGAAEGGEGVSHGGFGASAHGGGGDSAGG
jgi:hypothetical protein